MTNKFDVNLGNALREERQRRNLTQSEMAERLCVTKMTVSHWENGKRSMTAENLKRYCKALDVSVQTIIDKT